VPPQKTVAEPSDFIPAYTTVRIAATGVRTVGAVPAKMLPNWVTESIISLTVDDEKVGPPCVIPSFYDSNDTL